MSPLKKPGLLGRLLLLFTIVPVVELALLVWLGGRIGFWPTVGLIAATAVLGSFLAHREGLSALARFRARMASGEMPGAELTDGLIILVAGALLLTPGVLTDVAGFLGLLPPTRALIRRALTRRFQRGIGARARVAMWPPAPPSPSEGPVPGEVVDAEFEDLPPR